MTQANLKPCCACKQVLPFELFSFKNKATGRRQSRCILCQREYGRQHYESNKDYYIDKASLSRQAIDARNRAFVAELLKDERCACCEAREDLHYVLQGAQGQPVHQAVHCGLSVQRVKEAVARSRVFCGSCMARHSTTVLLREWGQLSQVERVRKQVLRAMGVLPTQDKGRFKRYRAADPLATPPPIQAGARALSCGTVAQPGTTA